MGNHWILSLREAIAFIKNQEYDLVVCAGVSAVKWLANISGVALVIGAALMIKNRLDKLDDQITSYKDWFLLGLVFALGLTGMLTEMARLAHLAGISYFFYYLHLIAIF